GSIDGSVRAPLPSVCKHCGRQDFKVSFLLCKVCYKCKAPGHMVKDCSILDDVIPVQSQRLTHSQCGQSFARGHYDIWMFG
ncbi:hypothetical protein V6N12_019906, partial [Hibiscus sabdariffa]